MVFSSETADEERGLWDREGVLYSPWNDPDPEMIPNPEMIPKELGNGD